MVLRRHGPISRRPKTSTSRDRQSRRAKSLADISRLRSSTLCPCISEGNYAVEGRCTIRQATSPLRVMSIDDIWLSAVPHRLSQDDYYEGHFIPKNTICIVNVW